MKLSEWKPFLVGWIDEIQTEAGIQTPTLVDLRAQIETADASVPKTRELLERELFGFVDSQAFLRQAAARCMQRKATEAMEQATALLKRAETLLPEGRTIHRETREDIEDSTGDEPGHHVPFDVMDVHEAIKRAERILPGQAATEGEGDPRWQAIMRIEDFIEEEPDAIWPFILRWGISDDEDLRTAIGVLLLEHLLGHHFPRFFPLVEDSVRKNPHLADTFLKCWKTGQAKEPVNSERFDALQLECRNAKRSK